MSQPPEEVDSSLPKSVRRINDVVEACRPLSSDGAAAVLAYARTMVEQTRRVTPTTPNLHHAEMWKFVGVVNDVAAEIKDVLILQGLKRRREYVFIALVYRALQQKGYASGMSLASFKARLLQARQDNSISLVTYTQDEPVSPLLLEASAVQGPRRVYHLIQRNPMFDVRHALEQVTFLLPETARPLVASFARRVHEDEALREGRPRLMTLDPEKFAARIQEFVDREPADVTMVTLFWKLEDCGEMTGLDFESFKARLLVAHRAGRLLLGSKPEQVRPDVRFVPVSVVRDDSSALTIVRRSSANPPIPWGPPHPPIIRRLVLRAP